MTDICLQVFSRPPVAGKVKTRLIAELGTNSATALHAYLAAKTLSAVAAAPAAARELWIDGDSEHPWVVDACATYGVTLRLQRGAELGARMANASASALASNLMPVIVGTDCWPLDATYLSAAAVALQSDADVVLGPVEDGGYVLIGLKHPAPALFHDMQWSVSTVLVETLHRCQRARLRVVTLPTLWDVDRIEDVARLRDLGVRWSSE